MSFSRRVLDWFQKHGRKDLPWQKDITPYRVWVSEIMLQQTQVATVIPYYQRFMGLFPDVASLAAASQDDVLAQWSGLGYYARGRNLHKAAQEVMQRFEGQFPCNVDDLQSLPGIGRSTAAAIASIACGQSEAILDGNVKRVLARHAAVEGWPGKTAVQKQLWTLAENRMSDSDAASYTQAMMDLGATVCTRSRPACNRCPVSEDCEARKLDAVAKFPASKPKKTKPQRTSYFLLVLDSKSRLMLYKRPPAGLWGGLWSFPELDESEDLKTYIERQWAMEVLSTEEWPSFKHSFSHYDLNILPVCVEALPSATVVKEMALGETLWYNTAEPLPGGVPAPVAILIEQFQAMQSASTDSN